MIINPSASVPLVYSLSSHNLAPIPPPLLHLSTLLSPGSCPYSFYAYIAPFPTSLLLSTFIPYWVLSPSCYAALSQGALSAGGTSSWLSWELALARCPSHHHLALWTLLPQELQPPLYDLAVVVSLSRGFPKVLWHRQSSPALP